MCGHIFPLACVRISAHTGERMNEEEIGQKFDEKFNDFGVKLFKYLDKRFDEVRGEIADVRADVQRVYGSLDAVLKNQEREEQERLALSQQVDRHERWIEQLAHTTGTKLRYEQ